MARAKIKLADNISRVVFVETEATIGATIGTDLRLPNGQVATLAQLQALFGGGSSDSTGAGTVATDHRLLMGLTLGDDHPQYTRKDTLTTRGDLYARGVSTVERLALGTNRQILRATATDPAWETISPTVTLGTDLSGNVTLTNLASGTLNATVVANAITDTKLRDSAGLSVVGRSTNTLGDPADIVGTDGGILRVSGTTLGFGSVLSTSVSDFAEAAQDAVGGILVSSSTITLTYADATPSITAAIVTASVSNSLLADMAQSRIKGRAAAAGTGAPTDLTPTEVMTIILGETVTWTGVHTWTQPLLSSFGAANLPGYAFSTYADTGMFRQAANVLGFATAGVERVRMDSSGIDIRASVPAFRLTETDAATDEGIWRTDVNSRVYRIRAFNDDLSLNAVVLDATRAAGATPAISAITIGNSTDNPPVTVPGRLLVSSGLVGTPGWAFSADTDNGAYRIGADNWGLSGGGTLQFELGTTFTDQKTQSRWTGVNSPAQLTANTNDWTGAAGSFTVVRFSTDASRNITGATGGVAGRHVWFVNTGSQPAVFTHNDAASTAGNRFLNATAGNKTVNAGGSITYWYDGTSAAWRQMAFTT